MKPLLYIHYRSFVNFFKDMVKKPLKLLGMLFYVGLLAFAIIGGLKSSSGGDYKSPEMLLSIISSVCIFFYGLTLLSSGNSKGLFRKSDVNFIFTSPVKPQKAIVYACIKNMGQLLIFIVMIAFNSATLVRFFNLKNTGLVNIYVSIIFCLISTSAMSVLLISLNTKYPILDRITKGIAYILGAILIAQFGFSYFSNNSLYDAFIDTFNNNVLYYVPLLGWNMEIVKGGLVGFEVNTIIFIGAFLLFITAIIYTINRMNLEYTEEMIQKAEEFEEALESVKDGKQMNVFVKKGKSKMLRGAKVNYSKSGAATIFKRQILEFKKRGIYTQGLKLLVFTIITFIAVYKSGESGFNIALGINLYFAFLMTMSGAIGAERKKHYIYLIPDSNFNKLFYSTLFDNLITIFNGLVIFLIAAVVFKISIINIVLNIAIYSMFHYYLRYNEIIFTKYLGNILTKQLKPIIYSLLLIITLALGGFIVGGMSAYIGESFTIVYGKIIALVYITILCLIFMIWAKAIFNNMELE
ncbi:putative ABC exporter domain-containing protein [Clostridium faecium]